MTLRGKAVVAYLQGPRERFWGILRALDPSGALIEGVGADHFESWARQVAREGEQAPPASLVFFPSTRIERLLLDRSSRAVPSLEDRFRGITGKTLAAHLGRGRPVQPVPFKKR